METFTCKHCQQDVDQLFEAADSASSPQPAFTSSRSSRLACGCSSTSRTGHHRRAVDGRRHHLTGHSGNSDSSAHRRLALRPRSRRGSQLITTKEKLKE